MSGGYVPTGREEVREGRRHLQVVCGCGREAWKLPGDMRKLTRCASCAAKKRGLIPGFNMRGALALAARHAEAFDPFDAILRHVRRNAIIRKLEVTVSAVEIQALWTGFCALSGIPLSLPQDGKHRYKGNCSASLDRKDSALGYISGNVQWVHKRINLMKGPMSDTEFIDWCKLVAAHNGGCDPAAAVIQSAAPLEDRP